MVDQRLHGQVRQLTSHIEEVTDTGKPPQQVSRYTFIPPAVLPPDFREVEEAIRRLLDRRAGVVLLPNWGGFRVGVYVAFQAHGHTLPYGKSEARLPGYRERGRI